MDMNEVTLDELLCLLGHKEMELYALRRELKARDMEIAQLRLAVPKSIIPLGDSP